MTDNCSRIPAIVVGLIDPVVGYEPVIFEDVAREQPIVHECVHEAWQIMRLMQVEIVSSYAAAEASKEVLEAAITFAIAEVPDGVKSKATWKVFPQADAFTENLRKAVTIGMVSGQKLLETVTANSFEKG